MKITDCALGSPVSNALLPCLRVAFICIDSNGLCSTFNISCRVDFIGEWYRCNPNSRTPKKFKLCRKIITYLLPWTLWFPKPAISGRDLVGLAFYLSSWIIKSIEFDHYIQSRIFLLPASHGCSAHLQMVLWQYSLSRICFPFLYPDSLKEHENQLILIYCFRNSSAALFHLQRRR